MTQKSNKPRTNGVKLLAFSLVLAVASFIVPLGKDTGPLLFGISALLLVIGIIWAIVDAAHNRRARNNPETPAIPSAPAAPTVMPTVLQSNVTAPTTEPPVPKKATTVERVHVRGLEHYTNNIVSVGIENPDYSLSKMELQEEFLDERVYQYQFFVKADLVPEPDNEHDPNAIMVQADGVCIGYVPKGSTAHIRKLMESGRIQSMDLNIGGGKYKEVSEIDDGEYELDRGELKYSAVLELRLTEEQDAAEEQNT